MTLDPANLPVINHDAVRRGSDHDRRSEERNSDHDRRTDEQKPAIGCM